MNTTRDNSRTSGRSTQAAGRAGKPTLEDPSKDRVVTLAALSRQLPDRLLARQLAGQLKEETGRSVLLIHLGSTGGSRLNWNRITPRGNGEFSLAGHLQVLGSMAGELTVDVAQAGWRNGQLKSLLQHCQEHFHYILLRTDAGVAVPLLNDCLHQSGRAFLLIQPRSKDLYHRDLLLRELRSDPSQGLGTIRTVFCRSKGEPHQSELLRNIQAGQHAYVHDCPAVGSTEEEADFTASFKEDLRRLAREIGRCRVGLALSSGGARGLAHVGVLQVLEENGIHIDVVAGCSMGSYVGAVWAFGYDGVYMEKLAREVEHRWGIFELVDPFLFPRRGFMRGDKVKNRLQRSIGDVHFAELRRPFRVVATNLSTLERVVFSTGEVAEAVHASSAIPGTCAPVTINGVQYTDGGVCDPMPVDLLEDMGIEKIIAVNTIPTPALMRYSEELRRESMVAGRPRSNRLANLLNQYVNYFAPGNILDTIFRSFHGAQMRVAEQACRRADLVIRPICFDGRWHDFTHPGKYIAIGRREAESRLDQVKALLKRSPQNHENRTTHNTLATVA